MTHRGPFQPLPFCDSVFSPFQALTEGNAFEAPLTKCSKVDTRQENIQAH